MGRSEYGIHFAEKRTDSVLRRTLSSLDGYKRYFAGKASSKAGQFHVRSSTCEQARISGPFYASEQTLGLPGGVTVSLRAGTASTWSYSNLQGASIAAATEAGARTGTLAEHDPFGSPLNLLTGQIGTVASDRLVPANTTTPGTSHGWESSHQNLNIPRQEFRQPYVIKHFW